MTGSTARFDVPGMVCGNCAATVTEALTALDGVDGVRVDLDAGTVLVETSSPGVTGSVLKVLDDVGYGATLRTSPE